MFMQLPCVGGACWGSSQNTGVLYWKQYWYRHKPVQVAEQDRTSSCTKGLGQYNAGDEIAAAAIEFCSGLLAMANSQTALLLLLLGWHRSEYLTAFLGF